MAHSTPQRKGDTVQAMTVTPRQAARIAHPALEVLGRLVPDLLPLTAAVNDELEKLYPELRVTAGPSDPPV